jgi:hypothetical protein
MRRLTAAQSPDRVPHAIAMDFAQQLSDDDAAYETQAETEHGGQGHTESVMCPVVLQGNLLGAADEDR